MDNYTNSVKLAERGAILSIAIYIFFSTLKLVVGYIGKSEALLADGWNNFTDILSNIFILIGLKMARTPSDLEHQYGHWKIENIASLITSVIMFLIGFAVLARPITAIWTNQHEKPDFLSGLVGLITGLIMFFVYKYNMNLAKKVSSTALYAAAKDNFSDMLSSFGASIGSFGGLLGFYYADYIIAVIIGIIILKSAYDIFMQSAFALSDGFDDSLINEYKESLQTIPGIDGISRIRGRSYGSHIYLELDVYMNPNMTVQQSHHITELIEQHLTNNFNVFHTEIHVEPTPDDLHLQ